MELLVRGRRAYAYTGGRPFDPALPCVVFIHGALHDHSVWTLLARWCAHHGYSVLAVDQPGHRRSEGPLCKSVEDLADWTLELMDAAGVSAQASQTTVVGHSMGSLIALEMASRAPQRFRSLVMVGTAYPMKVSDALLRAAANTPDQGMDLVNNLSFSSTACKPSYPGPGMWLHGSNRRLMALVQAGHPQANVFLHDFSLCNAYAGGEKAAERITCAVHAVLGELDLMTPPKAASLLAQRLNARVTRLKSGHAVMQEQPQGMQDALKAALA